MYKHLYKIIIHGVKHNLKWILNYVKNDGQIYLKITD